MKHNIAQLSQTCHVSHFFLVTTYDHTQKRFHLPDVIKSLVLTIEFDRMPSVGTLMQNYFNLCFSHIFSAEYRHLTQTNKLSQGIIVEVKVVLGVPSSLFLPHQYKTFLSRTAKPWSPEGFH